MRIGLIVLACAGIGTARGDVSVRIAAAETAYNHGEYRSADALLKDAESVSDATDEDRLRILNARATLLLATGRIASARESLVKAAALAAKFGSPWTQAAILHNLAAAELQLGRVPSATDREREALLLWQQVPGSEYYVQRALISLSSMQGLACSWTDAAKSLERALAFGPTAEALSNYAIVLERLHRTKEARHVRTRIKSLPPTPAVVNVGLLPFDRQGVSATVR